jgi:hypothetical protein
MSFLDLVNKENLVCTYCGKKPVVGVTFAIDAEIDPENETVSRELVENSIIATCKEHLPILQEQFEKEMKGAELVEGIGPEVFGDDNE